MTTAVVITVLLVGLVALAVHWYRNWKLHREILGNLRKWTQ